MHGCVLQGDTIASCDSYGVVKLWDVRTVSPMTNVDCGPHAANMVSFDPSGISSVESVLLTLRINIIMLAYTVFAVQFYVRWLFRRLCVTAIIPCHSVHLLKMTSRVAERSSNRMRCAMRSKGYGVRMPRENQLIGGKKQLVERYSPACRMVYIRDWASYCGCRQNEVDKLSYG